MQKQRLRAKCLTQTAHQPGKTTMSVARIMSQLTRSAIVQFATIGIVTSAAQAAPPPIEVWHTLTGVHETEFKDLVTRYNKEQNTGKVKVRSFASPKALQQAALTAQHAPHLIQLKDNHSPEVIAEHKRIKPLHALFAQYPIKNLKWFLPVTTSFIRDHQGRLLAFPFMAEVPVMFYNKALYQKAGLAANAPARTWTQLQDQLLKLRDVAGTTCPYASGDQVAVHLENLAPVNNQPYTSHANGIGKLAALASAKSLPIALQFNTLYMRHIALMASWKRAMLLHADNDRDQIEEKFAQGQCGVLTSRSSMLGQFMQTKSLAFGVAPLPHYEQETKKAGRPFVSGSAFWVMAGHPAAQEKATASFLAWLSKPAIAARWHQQTGYLPLTDAAFRASDRAFYQQIPGALQVVTTMQQQPAVNARGFRIANYPHIEPILSQSLNDALNGKTPSVVALKKAASQALSIASQRFKGQSL